ncbi:MAG: hypothetical protein ABIF82_04220 [Planctomycetota bacterium]
MKGIAKTLAVAACVAVVLSGLAPPVLAADATKPNPEAEDLLKKQLQEREVAEKYKRLLADHYFESGKKRFEERDYENAKRDFESALAANASHAKAKDYLASVRQLLGKTPAEEVLIGEINQERVEQGYQKARMLNATADARQLLRENNYDAALRRLDEAQNIAKVLATYVDVSAEEAEIGSLIDKASRARDAAKKRAEKEKLEQADRLARSEHERVLNLQRQRITRLIEDAKERSEETRYLDAIKKCDEVLKMDPRNEEVIAFRDQCHDKQIAADIKWYEEDKKFQTADTWRRTRKQAIPYTDWKPLYPDDWEEKRLRTAGIQIEVESEVEQKWKRDIEATLEEDVSFDFIATPLDDVVAFLINLKRRNIVVDKKAIEGRGALDVTLRLDKVKYKDALGWILRLLDLSYTLEDGAIYISTKEKIGASQKKVTKFYDVTDLTVDIRDFKPNLQAISSAHLDAEDMDDIFNEQDAGEGEETDRFTGESLVEFIKSVIAPGTWAEVGVVADIGAGL